MPIPGGGTRAYSTPACASRPRARSLKAVAKTESTAVTRLIELAQQRSPDGAFDAAARAADLRHRSAGAANRANSEDLDWFAPPRPRRIPREEVTQVVRVARRALRVHPGLVLGAFLAGMATVLLTTWATREPSVIAQVPPPQPTAAVVAAAQTIVSPVVTPAVAPEPPPPRPPIPAEVAVVAPEPELEPAPEPEPAPKLAPAPRAKPKQFKPAAPPRRPTPRDAGPLAELRINSKPPCELYIDGRRIGWTPQRGISVAPGRHTVIFRNREQGVERKVIVDAQVGQVHRLIRDFTEP